MKLDVGSGGLYETSSGGQGDINIDMVKPNHVPRNFVLCDARYLCFKELTFDEINMSQILEHLDDTGLRRVLAEARRVLKHHGLLTADFPRQFFLDNFRYYLVDFLSNIPFSLRWRYLRHFLMAMHQMRTHDPRGYHVQRDEKKIRRMVEQFFQIVREESFAPIVMHNYPRPFRQFAFWNAAVKLTGVKTALSHKR